MFILNFVLLPSHVGATTKGISVRQREFSSFHSTLVIPRVFPQTSFQEKPSKVAKVETFLNELSSKTQKKLETIKDPKEITSRDLIDTLSEDRNHLYKNYIQKAIEGDPESQLRVGAIYPRYWIKIKDIEKTQEWAFCLNQAQAWYKKVAFNPAAEEKDRIEAIYQIGQLYVQEYPDFKDIGEELIQWAADHDHHEARVQVGLEPDAC